MLKLSQQDKRWAADHLGSSPLLVGKYGCTTTCVSMISDDFGCYKSPLELAHNANNYTPDGLILWDNLNKTFEGKMRFVWRGYGAHGKYTPMTDFSPLLRALENPLQRVAIEVNDGAHWVKLVKKNALGRDWTAIDAWDGRDINVLARYGNITGYAIFEDLKPNIFVPDPAIDKALAARLAGSILLSVDERGRLYFVDKTGVLHSLGSTQEEVIANMAKLAIGITKADLLKLPWSK